MTDEVQHFTLNVQGMHCVNCAQGIEKRLKELGAVSASVSLASDSVQLTASPTLVPSLISGIRNLGYSVTEGENGEQGPWWKSLEAKVFFSITLTLPLLLPMAVPIHILHTPSLQLILSTPVVLLGLIHFGKSAFSSLKSGVPNMDVLISIGISASYIYSIIGFLTERGESFLFFETAASIVSFVLVGNLIESRSVKKTASAIGELARLQPTRARLVLPGIGKENIQEVDATTIQINDVVLVTTGEQIPADGQILSGECLINESMLTGESLDVEKSINDEVFGGTIISKGSVKVKTTAIGKETVLAGIIQLVSEAQMHKPKIQRIGDAVSAVFVPIVLIFAVATFLLCYLAGDLPMQESLLRSIAVLVVACPCAMGLATPTAVMVGVGRAAKMGILIRGGDTLERFASIHSVIFDKTGTITTGKFVITNLTVYQETENKVRSIIHALEEHSSHPVATSLRDAFSSAPAIHLTKIKEQKGLSVEGRDADGALYTLGSSKILPVGIENRTHDIYLLQNNILIAGLTINDDIKPEAKKVVSILKENKIYTSLLSGDSERKCKLAQDALLFDEYTSECTPEQKLHEITKLESFGMTAYVGDGINDAPALTRAHVGVSLSKASASAIKAARVVLLEGNLVKLIEGWKLSKATLRTIKQNLFWAFFYNLLMIPLAAFGFLSPGIAALAMALSDVFVIGNSLRLRTLKL